MTMVDALRALSGGALIGLGSALLLVVTGRVAGISGIVGGLVAPVAGDTQWRAWFLAGLLATGAVLARLAPGAFSLAGASSLGVTAAAGLLVGVGTRLGNGCTSGHGVCGVSRGSPRSLVATVTFIATGALAVLLARLFGGGAA